ncbi:MAG: ankyrin repeat domain-containing protein [Amoebophilaceae bacterium]|nr:ankyrin repeat domain-containing protein [Amoebophilaceae bacterium]
MICVESGASAKQEAVLSVTSSYLTLEGGDRETIILDAISEIEKQLKLGADIAYQDRVGKMLLNSSEEIPCINVLDIQNRKGETALMIAVKKENVDMVKALLNYSQKPTMSLINQEGKTTLDIAKENKVLAIIGLLENK